MPILKELIRHVEVKKIYGTNGLTIEGIAYDSRKVKKDFLFACLRGSRLDGHDFVIEARSRGATAIVVEKASEINGGLTQIVVPDTRIALGKLANNFYDSPTRSLQVIGVTGTDGKTTTTRYIKSILEEAGIKSGLVGTINYELGDRVIPAERTTPESLDLQFLFSQMLKEQLSHAVIEVSSHGLSQHRVDEIDFKVAVFTNLSHEHLDFHKGMDEYFLAKRSLFEKDIEKGVVNIDDEFGKKLKDFLGDKSLGFGISDEADLKAGEINGDMNGTRYKIKGLGIETDVVLSLIGRHNVHNSLAAIGVGLYLGLPMQAIKRGIEKLANVPGRFELIKCGQPYTIIVDYAHTPRALENALTETKYLSKGRVIVVFGCGGDRDPYKRPIMGEIATRLADHVIITSDNPRGEDPLKIIQDIVSGVSERKNYTIQPDREKAIARALDMAETGDCVLLAGKGHEKYQIFSSVYLPFDDVEKVTSILHGTYPS